MISHDIYTSPTDPLRLPPSIFYTPSCAMHMAINMDMFCLKVNEPLNQFPWFGFIRRMSRGVIKIDLFPSRQSPPSPRGAENCLVLSPWSHDILLMSVSRPDGIQLDKAKRRNLFPYFPKWSSLDSVSCLVLLLVEVLSTPVRQAIGSRILWLLYEHELNGWLNSSGIYLFPMLCLLEIKEWHCVKGRTKCTMCTHT